MRPLALALPLALFAAGTAAGKPNVVVIVADDLGYADLGAHGGKQIPTPNIDALAAGGTRFTSGYVSGPYCSPTRAGLLTGRYQTRFGHEFNPGPDAAKNFGLSLKETTLAERMKGAGYRTALVGKWHLGRDEFHPQKRGFDEFYGFLGGAHSYTKPGLAANAILRGTDPVDEKEYLTDALGREAAAFVGRQAGNPFFLYLAFNAVHTPLEATDKTLARVPESVTDKKRRPYLAMLAAMDDAVGRLTAKLKETGAEKETLIFFVSDNGGPEQANGSDNGPLHGGKATTWEGGVRVPFFVSWPGVVPAGKLDDRPVIQLDVAPTALAAAGVDAPADAKFDGVNLLPYLKGEKADAPHAALFWRFGAQTAVRAGDWKLTKAVEPGANGRAGAVAAARRQKGGVDGAKLFNLKDDVGENADLAAKNPEKVKELAALWAAWDAGNAAPAWVPGARKNANAAD